jgi:hypothetical protein
MARTNSEGQLEVSVNKNLTIGPTLISTIPYTQFTASATLFKSYIGVLNRAAKMRTFHFINNLDKEIPANITIYVTDSVFNPTVERMGASTGLVNSKILPQGGNNASIPSGGNIINGDSCLMTLPMGSAAPTSGNVLIYVTEVM